MVLVVKQAMSLLAINQRDEVIQDMDGDGFLDNEDCDDNDPQVNPGMEELVTASIII